jgi:hypothetical protein
VPAFPTAGIASFWKNLADFSARAEYRQRNESSG